jgi:hypothetical protein
VAVLDEDILLSAHDIAQICALSLTVIQEWLGFGLLDFLSPAPAEWRFPASVSSRLNTAIRLSDDLGICSKLL